VFKKLNWTNQNLQENYRSPISWWKTFSTILTWHAIRTHGLEQIGWNKTRKSRLATVGGLPVPWWTYSSIQFIDQTISSHADILEVGGGSSSIFWANRGNRVVTLESNPQWIETIRSLTTSTSSRIEIVQIEEETPECISMTIGNQKFDVVINDGAGDRIQIADLLLESLKPSGIMIWDNSERSEYADKIHQIKNCGWKELVFSGLGPINAYASSTSIFYKDEIRIH